MSLRHPRDVDADFDAILGLATERNLSFEHAQRAWRFGARVGDGQTPDPRIFDLGRSEQEIAAEMGLRFQRRAWRAVTSAFAGFACLMVLRSVVGI